MMHAESALAGISNLPNIWGEGALFAFSGMDGPTASESQLVATFAIEPFDLLIHTPRRRVLSIRTPQPAQLIAATGDVLAAGLDVGELLLTFSAWHTLIGSAPEASRLSLRAEHASAPEIATEYQIDLDPDGGDALVLTRSGQRFALAHGRSQAEAEQRAQVGLAADLTAVIVQRLAVIRNLPTLDDPQLDRLLKKCVSVMKVNTLGPEGAMSTRWSTPDRVPHRHLWLWDSVFHSLGMNHVDPELAWDFLHAVFARQQPDGIIPHMMWVNGRVSEITQPPILAWGVWQNYQRTGDKERLAYALPRLEHYLSWNLAQRDQNGNGLLEWYIEGDPFCRSGESGMDNSPRFDDAVALDAVDFSVFQAHDMAYVAHIAAELGLAAQAARWQAQADSMCAAIHHLLWDDELGFYLDRAVDGRLSPVRAISGLLPLLLDDLPAARVDRLLAHLQDPQSFATIHPVPSVAQDDPTWSTDMWRGATWVNMNYLLVHGLRKQGRTAAANQLRRATIGLVDKYVRQFGVTFEFYDARDRVPPPVCARKGPVPHEYDLRHKMSSIRDYHWTAALVADLLFSEE